MLKQIAPDTEPEKLKPDDDIRPALEIDFVHNLLPEFEYPNVHPTQQYKCRKRNETSDHKPDNPIL
ncbi:MAG: hypothetical protein ACXWV6_14935 [Chitinophagaceae bacterium]